ncbi:MAG TPA: hypothetical protein VFM88_17525 [Vicinamibacteria bacterium]|nr:hypothetical protein [Vicinamibacteria bacterium]
MAVFAALLPARLRRDLEAHLPIRAMAFPSAILQIAAGYFIGLDGFLRYAAGVAEGANRLTGEIGLAMGLSGLSIFTFALLTPQGLVASYLVITGSARALFAASSGVPGDPLLALADHVYLARRRRSAEEQAIAERQAREGAAVPDVLETGPTAGFPDADWVVIASRLKPGWEKGVFVVTTDRWYRIADGVDRRTPDGLRRFYVLHAVGQAEVIRRSVFYDHPQLSALHDRKSETPASRAELRKG